MSEIRGMPTPARNTSWGSRRLLSAVGMSNQFFHLATWLHSLGRIGSAGALYQQNCSGVTEPDSRLHAGQNADAHIPTLISAIHTIPLNV